MPLMHPDECATIGEAHLIVEKLWLKELNYELLIGLMKITEEISFREVPLHLRLSFLAPWIDYNSQKKVFSATKKIESKAVTGVIFDQIPELACAISSLRELSNKRLLILLWCREDNSD